MRILIAIERSDYAEIVLEHGLDAAVREGGADLDVVTFISHTLDIADTRTWLDGLVHEALEAFGEHGLVTLHVLTGDPVSGVMALATEMQVDLLVIGRFHVPSRSDRMLELAEQLDCPTLVIGLEGAVLEPQCRACRMERRASNGERWFCEQHAGGRMADLTTRIPPLPVHGSRLW